MGLGFSIDGGQAWTNSLVPGYPADTSAEGMQSPEFIRTNSASDPVGAFDDDGHFFLGFLAYNGNAGPETNSDAAVARYDVVDPETNGGNPLDSWARPGSQADQPRRTSSGSSTTRT
jgi:hypothetical protein